MRDAAVGFHDLEFDHAFRCCRTRDGTTTTKWVPVGMPRVSENLQRCVFFLFEHDLSGRGFSGPGGTGFFVARSSESLFGLLHIYAVSNWHVVNPHSTIRMNTPQGAKFIEFDPSEWCQSETDDLAVVDVTDRVPFVPTIHTMESEISWIAENSFVTNSSKGLVFSDAALGDQTIMLGLFTDYHGGETNIPVGRFGNLAALPNIKAPIRLSPNDPFARPAFLNDIRSRAGFSGSPVWAWYSLYSDINIDKSGGLYLDDEPRRHALLSLIGVHRGQFLDPPTGEVILPKPTHKGYDPCGRPCVGTIWCG